VSNPSYNYNMRREELNFWNRSS